MDQPHSILKGWRSLPDELKLIVLGHALPCGTELTRGRFSKSTVEKEIAYIKDTVKERRITEDQGTAAITAVMKQNTELLPFFATPEIAQLAIEVLYKQNTIDLGDQLTLLPPPSVRQHVRTISIAFELSLDFLRKLSTFFYGKPDFPNLKAVKIDVFPLYNCDSVTVCRLRSLPKIWVRTKELRVSLIHGTERLYAPQPYFFREVVSDDKVAAVLLPKFTVLSARGVDVKEERYMYDHFKQTHKVIVGSWPHTEEQKVTSRVVRGLN